MPGIKQELSFYRIFRFLLIFFFVLVSVVSVVQIAINATTLSQGPNSLFLKYSSIGVLLISSGAIPLVISILSLCFVIIGGLSLKRMSTRLLLSYAILSLFVSLLGLATAVACLVVISQTKTIENNLINEYATQFQLTQNSVSDYFQINLRCCGLFNQSDWNGFAGSTSSLAPCSCCINQCPYSYSNCKIFSDETWNSNCLGQMIFFLKTNVNLNSGILVIHSTVVLIGSIISFVFYKLFQQEKYMFRNETNIISTERSEKTEETQLTEERNEGLSRRPSDVSKTFEPQTKRKFSLSREPSMTDLESKF